MTSKWPLNDLKMTFKLKSNYRFLKHKLSAFHWYISCHDVKKLIFCQYDMIWYDMIWYDMIWYDMIWYDMTIQSDYKIWLHV